MFKLKAQTILLLLLIFIGFGSIGVIIYNGINKLNDQVISNSYPRQKSILLKKITLDHNKLNNLYLIDSINFSSTQADSLIFKIEKNLKLIQPEIQSSTLNKNVVDTIPALLKSIKAEYLNLERLKIRTRIESENELKIQLEDKLEQLKLSEKDSITIIKQINSEILERSVIKDTTNNQDNRNFFQKLFGIEKKTTPKDINDSIYKPKTEIDTTVYTRIDTLGMLKNDSISKINQIVSVVQNIEKRRTQNLENIAAKENEIFLKNIKINNYIENILNEILANELENFNTSIDNFSETSENYLKISGIIIFLLLLIAGISIFVIIKDINKTIFYQKQLQASKNEALKKAKEHQQFLYLMSHELRTPLTSIIGYSELLQEKNETVDAIQSTSNYLYNLINEILDTAKLNAGIIELNKQVFSLNDLIKDAEKSFKPLLEQDGLEADFICPKNDVYVESDKYRLQQILYNLLNNASKYTHKGHVKLETQIVNTSKNYVEVKFEIKDTGVGINEKEIKTIFKDFAQARRSNTKFKGTGLGLGIVKKIVNQLNGNIKIDSEINQGTSVTLNFKFKKSKPEKITTSISIHKFEQNILSGYKCIIVDDDPLIVNLYKNILVQYGLDIKTFTDPLKAKKHLENEHYDLAIFDLKMPGLTGVELFKCLIKIDRKPKFVVASTANVNLTENDKKDFKRFDYLLTKPVKKNDLIKVLVKAFDINTVSEKSEQSLKLKTKDFELESIYELANKDDNSFYDMLNLLVEENQKDLEALDLAIQNQNFEIAEMNLHKLKSRFEQVGVKTNYNIKETEKSLSNQEHKAFVQVNNIFKNWCLYQEKLKAIVDKKIK
ncbi:MAG: response regulator [Bacteroidetes bacterium]|jgi:signal transduction histidine kinase/CheY-like chemotaxis protein|nr:response regulator [Bacteroidota bacterium]